MDILVDGQVRNLKVEKILVKNAVPGMVLARDVYTDEENLVLGEKMILAEKTIKHLKGHFVREIFIYVPDGKKTVSRQAPQRKTYNQQIKETREFRKFDSSFKESVSEVKDQFNSIVSEGAEIDTEVLLSETDRILKESTSGIHVLDMMSCMRDMDDLTYVHSVNVALICNVFGNWLKLPKDEIRVLTLGGILHDIGKLKIPLEILTKPGKLTDEEYEIIKKHSYYGYDTIKNKEIEDQVKLAVLLHHERTDGSGYPGGFPNQKIAEAAKIVAIADVYDAMTANRVYRIGMCPFKVINIFEEEGMTKYDPKYIIPIMEMLVQSYIGNSVRLSNNMAGEVIMINKNALSRPVVRVGNDFIDLSKDRKVTIEAII